MKVLVCGGREFADTSRPNRYSKQVSGIKEEERMFLRAYLHSWHASKPITLLIHGDCVGADRQADAWAYDVGHVQRVACPANWDHFQKRAGYERNKAMLLLNPDVVIAFPGGSGTADMCRQAEAAGVRVVRVSVPG